jgi:hypothetical protein
MRLILQYIFWTLGLGLQVVLINALLRGSWRRQPLIFVYCIALFLTTTLEVATSTMARSGARALARSWRVYYWIDDAILQTLIFCVVISLLYQATRKSGTGTVLRRALIAGAVLIWIFSFLWHRGPWQDLSAWMTLISRDLSFAAVILDLLLWSTLIAFKKKETELLMLSGGLGIEFTGSAIGQSVRQLAQSGRHANAELAGSVLVVVSSLMCLYVWWQTFRRYSPERTGRPT